jgi:hypothetical protein
VNLWPRSAVVSAECVNDRRILLSGRVSTWETSPPSSRTIPTRTLCARTLAVSYLFMVLTFLSVRGTCVPRGNSRTTRGTCGSRQELWRARIALLSPCPRCGLGDPTACGTCPQGPCGQTVVPVRPRGIRRIHTRRLF